MLFHFSNFMFKCEIVKKKNKIKSQKKKIYIKHFILFSQLVRIHFKLENLHYNEENPNKN